MGGTQTVIVHTSVVSFGLLVRRGFVFWMLVASSSFFDLGFTVPGVFPDPPWQEFAGSLAMERLSLLYGGAPPQSRFDLVVVSAPIMP
jgi:hypothetical protein